MDIDEIEVLVNKLKEAREAGYGVLIDAHLEQDKSIAPTPVMLMAELEHFVQRIKTVSGDFGPHWLQDMNSRIDALVGEVKECYYVHKV